MQLETTLSQHGAVGRKHGGESQWLYRVVPSILAVTVFLPWLIVMSFAAVVTKTSECWRGDGKCTL